MPIRSPRPAAPLAALPGALGAVVLTLALSACHDGPPRPKKMDTVKLLPDTPPPPPPPKQEEKKPEPQKEDKPQQQPDVPKPVQAPQPQALKTDEAPGDGPGGGLQSGAVTQDYAGGAIGSAASAAGTQSDRAQFRFFINTARQQLQDELERNLRSDDTQIVAEVALWLSGSGQISRFELKPTGSAAADGQLRAALAQTAQQLRLPPPAGLPQPVMFRVTLRPLS